MSRRGEPIIGKYAWPAIGIAAVAVSIWLLFKELRGLSIDQLGESLAAISHTHWLLCAASAVLAYLALAGYDALALSYLKHRVNFLFITLTSFTTYALSHNLGASVLSGSIIRYRAYSSKGMSGLEIGQLIAFCSFTFALGTILLTGLVLTFEPSVGERFINLPATDTLRWVGILLLVGIAAYVYGSWKQFRPLTIGPLKIYYPQLRTVALQLLIGPLEIMGAAAIIYFALPEAGNPGYFVVLGIFLLSFSAALLSSAPGGLGVLELLFVNGLSEMRDADVLAALLVFRLLYLLIPLALSIAVVLVFERRRMREA
ncbi:uncharacterized membrane protein YbhN (UPF0104 family) [Neorhizobium galegae]|uniref:lysylphosphatidylglycerol synthase transmembrane domain-containing protein n=1 Tax=Neorhizobium galegae TaxID=399 RepID=UPI0032AE8396|nr:uncharacterized membrane protein YbhN (UPF0104 family) [Neorhizobium galegae]